MAQVVKEPFTLTLSTPVEQVFRSSAGDRTETISLITIRPPKAGDMRVVDGATGDIGAALAMISRLSDQPLKVIEDLSVEDFQVLAEKLGEWMGKSPATGETS